MNNKVTGLLIGEYARRLDEAISDIKKDLPDEICTYTKDILGSSIKDSSILDEVKNILSDMSDASELLSHEN